jgi:hypothetical protein
MDDLIIGCSTNYDWSKIKYWINSVNQSGFKGKKVMILMNCDLETTTKVLKAGFEVISFGTDAMGNLTHQSPFMVHVERFLHIYNYLKDNEFRYVITTDVKDVIFQKNPSEWLEENLGHTFDQMHISHPSSQFNKGNLVFSSESILYKDEPWGDNNLMETFGPYIHDIFKENEIYNVGVLAGRGYAMRDLALNIFLACVGKPIKICDQSTFNVMISMNPYLKTSLYKKSEDGWACQLGTTADPSKIEQFKPFLLEPSPIMQDGKVVTSTGKEFSIVHQYDRVPEWRKIIEAKYE